MHVQNNCILGGSNNKLKHSKRPLDVIRILPFLRPCHHFQLKVNTDSENKVMVSDYIFVLKLVGS